MRAWQVQACPELGTAQLQLVHFFSLLRGPSLTKLLIEDWPNFETDRRLKSVRIIHGWEQLYEDCGNVDVEEGDSAKKDLQAGYTTDSN